MDILAILNHFLKTLDKTKHDKSVKRNHSMFGASLNLEQNLETFVSKSDQNYSPQHNDNKMS